MAITDTARRMFAYALIGSQYQGGWSGTQFPPQIRFYGGTSNVDPFQRTYDMGDVFSGLWGGLAVGNGGAEYRGGTIPGGTLWATLSSFRVDQITNSSTYGPLYSTNANAFGTFGTMYFTWSLQFPAGGTYPAVIALADHLCYGLFGNTTAPAKIISISNLTLFDADPTQGSLIVPCIGSSVGTDSMVATLGFGGFSTRVAPITPTKMVIYGSSNIGASGSFAFATFLKFRDDPFSAFGGGNAGTINNMLNDSKGAGWYTVGSADLMAYFIYARL